MEVIDYQDVQSVRARIPYVNEKRWPRGSSRSPIVLQEAGARESKSDTSTKYVDLEKTIHPPSQPITTHGCAHRAARIDQIATFYQRSRPREAPLWGRAVARPPPLRPKGGGNPYGKAQCRLNDCSISRAGKRGWKTREAPTSPGRSRASILDHRPPSRPSTRPRGSYLWNNHSHNPRSRCANSTSIFSSRWTISSFS